MDFSVFSGVFFTVTIDFMKKKKTSVYSLSLTMPRIFPTMEYRA